MATHSVVLQGSCDMMKKCILKFEIRLPQKDVYVYVLSVRNERKTIIIGVKWR